MNSAFKDRLLRLRWQIVHMDGRQFRRLLYKVTRPSSHPYISGDGFRRLAKHRFDETNRHLEGGAVREGDTVFVCTDFAAAFFAQVDPAIAVHYRLITHNSDMAADESLICHWNDKISVWFAQNNTFRHPRVVPIPIGLENLHHWNVGVPSEYATWRQYSGPRQNRILAGFSVATNPGERQSLLDLVATAPSVDTLAARLSQAQYLSTLAAHKFVLSPPGNGLDTHRTWEAIYLGVIPIVRDSVAMRAFSQLGLPLWIVGRWEELLNLSGRELQLKYDELEGGFKSRALWMDYWTELILGQRPEPDPISAEASWQVSPGHEKRRPL